MHVPADDEVFAREVMVYSVDCVVLTVPLRVGVDVVCKAGVVVLRLVGQRHEVVRRIDEESGGGVEACRPDLVGYAIAILEEAVCSRKTARGEEILTEAVTDQVVI